MTSYERKKQMYRDYYKELCNMCNIKFRAAYADRYFDSYLNDETCKWINISDNTVDQSDIFAGFLIIGKSGKNIHPDSTYAVCEAYVDPKYRGHDMCKRTLSEYLDRHEGVWSLIVLRANTGIDDYWDDVFSSNGYHRVKLADMLVKSAEKQAQCIGYSKEDI